MSDEAIKTHPVQLRNHLGNRIDGGRCPMVVTLLAYEVYCAVFGPQEAMVTGDCRGGFGAGELIAFLYARNFPRSEWVQRVDEALRGMERM
jgi:hypothetical protein